MNKIEVLDCTLRDGGYVNNWAFGENNIVKLLKNLQLSNIDIIECGFLSKKKEAHADNSIFNSIEELEKIIPSDKKNCKFVCMINFGEISISNIPASKESCVDGIRVAFHKKDLYEAMIFCEEISKKGYLVFIQPMVTISYSDTEVLELIALSNKINPYALYIADSFGVMKRDDLLRLIYLFHHNLISGIHLGYHAHNNLQCAFSNAEAFIELHLNRNILIDSSVYGMGRGAGNLNTELLVNYLNSNFDKNYIIQPILKSIDECINKIYSANSWGYSLPHFCLLRIIVILIMQVI